MPRLRPALFLGTLFVATSLILAGCSNWGPPEFDRPPTPTLIATMPAPTATPVPPAPTATPEVAEAAPTEAVTTEEGDESAATEPTAEAEATEETPTTAEMTESEEITAAEEVTDTEAVTTEEGDEGEEITAGEEATDDAGFTTGAEATATGEITSATEITDSATLTTAADVRVFFLQPTDNAIVPLTFTVAISYTGLTVAADDEEAGHIHLLVDTDFVEAGETIVDDETHLHFEDGATTVEVGLTAGSHILRLQYTDSNHVALEGEQFRHTIFVNAVDGAPEQGVRIVSPSSGATVPPTFEVVMAATGLNVEPAGLVNEGSGHFHLLIDEPFVAPNTIVPANDTHLHFGKAQLTTTVTLEPGVHTLRLQFADGEHRALAGNQYRAEVQVIVEENAPEQQVMFTKPADEATVTSPFLVAWAASGLIIETAGNVIRPEGGHLHILVDEEFVPGGEAIPTDDTHLHFGRGQTSVELTLEPGEHTLRLQMANGAHIAHDGPQYQDEITVTVR